MRQALQIILPIKVLNCWRSNGVMHATLQMTVMTTLGNPKGASLHRSNDAMQNVSYLRMSNTAGHS